jgi:hypothetical protein
MTLGSTTVSSQPLDPNWTLKVSGMFDSSWYFPNRRCVSQLEIGPFVRDHMDICQSLWQNEKNRDISLVFYYYYYQALKNGYFNKTPTFHVFFILHWTKSHTGHVYCCRSMKRGVHWEYDKYTFQKPLDDTHGNLWWDCRYRMGIAWGVRRSDGALVFYFQWTRPRPNMIFSLINTN